MLAQATALRDLYHVGWRIEEDVINWTYWNGQSQSKKRGARARKRSAATHGHSHHRQQREEEGGGGRAQDVPDESARAGPETQPPQLSPPFPPPPPDAASAAGAGAAAEEALEVAHGSWHVSLPPASPAVMAALSAPRTAPPAASPVLPAAASSDKRKAWTGDADSARKRARDGNGGDDSGDLAVRIASSEPMAGPGLGGSSASATASEARSATAAVSGAAKVSSKDPPAPDASGQLQDKLERELQDRCLASIGKALLEFGISKLHEMRVLLKGLADDDLEKESEFRRELDVPLTKFQVRTLRQWKKELQAVVDLTAKDNARVKPERPSP